MDEATPGAVAETVELAAIGLPRLVFALLRQRFSGVVTLAQDGPAGGPRTVWFQGGMPIFTDWVSPPDSLGQILVDTGQITAEERDRAVAAVAAAATHERFGHYLVRRRLLTTAQLRKALRVQCARKLVHCFALRSGGVLVTPGEAGPIDEHTLGAQVNALELIFAGVSTHYDWARIAGEMGPAIDAPLRLRSSLGRYRPHFHFSPADEALLAAFSPSATIAEAAERTGQPRERAAQVAHTLWACQMLKPAAALRDPATGEHPETEPVRKSSRPSGPDKSSRPAGPDKSSIGAGDISPERVAEFTAELERIEAAVASGAHAFDLLGLPRTAERPQIRAAWHGLSRRFHPDALHHQELGHLRERSEAVFASLNEAYQILSDPAQREALVTLLRAGMRPGSLHGPAGLSGGPHAPVPTPHAILESEVAMREADTALRLGNFDRALERYQKAASLSPDEVEPQVAVAWCEYQRALDKPARREATRTTLLQLLKTHPRCARAHYYLGLLHVHAGEDEAALAAFAAALEQEPEMIDAKRQVHAIELRRKPPQDPPRRGLFGGR
ncbi:MAG: DnaJ domain-containing protein [Myxococcales bacterium]|nr:DnaJ domain-containing protein [Myxococcales bacterium]